MKYEIDGKIMTEDEVRNSGKKLICTGQIALGCSAPVFASMHSESSKICTYEEEQCFEVFVTIGKEPGTVISPYIYYSTNKGYVRTLFEKNVVELFYTLVDEDIYNMVSRDQTLITSNTLSGVNGSANVEEAIKNMTPNANDGIEYALSTEYDPSDSMTEDDIEINLNSVGDNSLKDATAFLKDPKGVFGMPYQYLESNDYPIEGSDLGSMYTEKIVQHLPVLLISPGRPNFMSDYSSGTAKGVLTRMLEGDNIEGPSLESILGDESGKFYSFDYKYIEYYNYVNPICQKMAMYLRIHDHKGPTSGGLGATLATYDWKNYASKAFKTYYAAADTVAFYIDSETQISESFSNSTTESQMASGINSLSSMSREIQFLIGGSSGAQWNKLKADNTAEFSNEINSFVKKYSSLFTKKFQSNLQDGILNVATGGKMIFPEIWADSTFSKSYSVNIKLRTPDSDKLSIYYNILVPLAHLIGLVAPLQNGVNGIMSPFIVRAHYKGFFTSDMAIITDLSISKGDKCKWTMDGLPTEVDVSLTIKDLYQILSLSSQREPKNFARNNQELDYIANMCGLNINKPDIIRSITQYYYQYVNFAKSSVTNAAWSINKNFNALLKGIYSRP